VFVPLNTAYQKTELEHFVTDAKPGVVVCKPSSASIFADLVKDQACSMMTLDRDGTGSFTNSLPVSTGQSDIVKVQADDMAVIIYTSGTQHCFQCPRANRHMAIQCRRRVTTCLADFSRARIVRR
jgi:malonyl-CoA/methylmalonyl-CoA synthetase